jgi:HSP20 family protein
MARQKKANHTKAASGPKLLEQIDKPAEVATRLAATPFEFMKRFGEEMDNLFGEFGFGRGSLTQNLERRFGAGLWTPQVEMFERNGELVVRADLPGMRKDDVKVEVTDDGITIEGERRNEDEEKGEGFYRTERSYGKFYRRLPIPAGIDPEDATATFNNGVLEVTMAAPKRTSSKTRRVEIRDESRPHAKRKAA